MEKGYKNVVYFLLILVAFVALGFYKPYFALFPDFGKPINTLVHIHALALLSWVLLLIVQLILIIKRQYAAHRLLGKFSYFLVTLIIVTSIGVMKKQYDEDIELKMSAAESVKALIIPFGEILTFSIFYLLAIIYRNKISFHLRYIICTALVLITPSLARVMGYWFDVKQLESYITCFTLIDLIIIVLIIYDLKNGKNFKPYVLALWLFLVFDISWWLIGHPF